MENQSYKLFKYGMSSTSNQIMLWGVLVEALKVEYLNQNSVKTILILTLTTVKEFALKLGSVEIWLSITSSSKAYIYLVMEEVTDLDPIEQLGISTRITIRERF